MNGRTQGDPMGALVTVAQMCQTSNLGVGTVREIAKLSGAERRIGRSIRIRREVFLDYIDRMYS